MSISLKTQKMLWGRAANRCSMCRRELVMDETETDDASIIGDICHIVAKEPNGPRGESELTPQQRDQYANLILLCKVHHKQIDDQINTYTVEVLRGIKAKHEDWVRSTLEDYDSQRQRDDELYADYIQEWEQRANLENWLQWSSWILGGEPQLFDNEIKRLRDLNRWLISRVWPKRYGELEAAFQNFQRVLDDFLRTFTRYLEPWEDMQVTRKFYKIPNWDPELYDGLLKQYNFHVDLVEDLMLELTRAANFVCDMIRRYILSSFRLEEGVLLIQSGMDMDMQVTTYRTEYQGDERSLMPYPGLAQFLVERSDRDLCFGAGISSSDPEFIELERRQFEAWLKQYAEET